MVILHTSRRERVSCVQHHLLRRLLHGAPGEHGREPQLPLLSLCSRRSQLWHKTRRQVERNRRRPSVRCCPRRLRPTQRHHQPRTGRRVLHPVLLHRRHFPRLVPAHRSPALRLPRPVQPCPMDCHLCQLEHHCSRDRHLWVDLAVWPEP